MPTNSLFQLTFPEEWEDITVHTFRGPLDSGVQHNIVLMIDTKIDKNTDLSGYARQQITVSEQVLPGFEIIKENENILSSGIPIYEVVYKYAPSDEQMLFQKQIFLIYEGKAYTFTSTFSKKTLKTLLRDVDQIIATFRPVSIKEQ